MCWPLAKTNQPRRVFPPAVAKCFYVLLLDDTAPVTHLQCRFFGVASSVSQSQLLIKNISIRLPNQIIITNLVIDKSFDKMGLSSLASPVTRGAIYWRDFLHHQMMKKCKLNCNAQVLVHSGAVGRHLCQRAKSACKFAFDAVVWRSSRRCRSRRKFVLPQERRRCWRRQIAKLPNNH